MFKIALFALFGIFAKCFKWLQILTQVDQGFNRSGNFSIFLETAQKEIEPSVPLHSSFYYKSVKSNHLWYLRFWIYPAGNVMRSKAFHWGPKRNAIAIFCANVAPECSLDNPLTFHTWLQRGDKFCADVAQEWDHLLVAVQYTLMDLIVTGNIKHFLATQFGRKLFSQLNQFWYNFQW